ncbi:MAG: ABC transporter ATP-binding protein [Clostridia bacterium]|nr:ABC transporter ATP-binding protein [Clostridia bacterium]
MIEAQNLTKRFDGYTALDAITCTIPDGCVYGMVGSNGAGKSTFLRTVCGIYRPDGGRVTVDGQPIHENPAVKSQLLLVPDDLYLMNGASPEGLMRAYAAAYPYFDKQRAEALLSAFRLPKNRSTSTFSKGMKRLTVTALSLACRARYIFFDETMDGLDPVMRHVVKSVIADDVASYGTTAVVVSHSLRELEDLCDQLALIHRGGMVLQQDVSTMKTSLFKVQIAFGEPFDRSAFPELSIVHYVQHGSVANMIVSGDREEAAALLRAKNPLLCELLPLTLEEVFTYELQARGYDFNTITEGLTS